jgi:hypothetical protein
MKLRPFRLLVASIASLGASGYVHAEQLAFVRADQPTVSTYVPAPPNVFNDGHPVHIYRVGIGSYSVRFGRLGDASNLQVSMYGDTTGYCSAQLWREASADLRCFDATGHPADRRFTVVVFKGENVDRHDAAYLWLNQAELPGRYTAEPSYSFPSTFTAQRSSLGNYVAWVGAIAEGPVGMLVSSYGVDARCAPLARSSDRVMVGCRTAAGEPYDSAVTLLLIRSGFADASFATSTFGGRGVGEGWASDGSTQRLRRVSTGRYVVSLGPEAGTGGVVQASSYFSPASCHAVDWSGGSATVRCDRNGQPFDSAFTVAALRPGGARREVHITQSAWSGILQLAARGLRVSINNYDPSNSSPLTCIPDCVCSPNCPPAYHALLRNGSVITYHSSFLGADADFTTRFTPQSVWRNPFLFLLNNINLRATAIRARADHDQVVLDLPFESNGREVATACHEDVRCGWGAPDGNNKPNAEIDNLVIHVPFRLSVDRAHGAPRILTTLGRVSFDANVQRAGACRDNALAVFCDLFGGDIESRIRSGIQTALNGFVARSAPVQATINRGVNTAVCQLARLQGQNCAQLSDVRLESDGDLTLVFGAR